MVQFYKLGPSQSMGTGRQMRQRPLFLLQGALPITERPLDTDFSCPIGRGGGEPTNPNALRLALSTEVVSFQALSRDEVPKLASIAECLRRINGGHMHRDF